MAIRRCQMCFADRSTDKWPATEVRLCRGCQWQIGKVMGFWETQGYGLQLVQLVTGEVTGYQLSQDHPLRDDPPFDPDPGPEYEHQDPERDAKKRPPPTPPKPPPRTTERPKGSAKRSCVWLNSGGGRKTRHRPLQGP